MNDPRARRCLRVGILAVSLLATHAHAQPASAPVPASAAASTPLHTIAVISLVGDRIDVVTAVRQTGRLNDANEHNLVPFAAAGLDVTALSAAKTQLKKLDPTLDVALLAASRPETYEAQDSLFDGDRVKLPAEIATAVEREHASQLVLVTRYRGEARLNGTNGALGTGKIGGLGFYLDSVARIKSSKTGAVERGMIAPFAYVELSLVDVATSAVVRRTNATNSYLLGTAGMPADANPWDILTPEQKVEALQRVLGRAVREALPALMAAPAAK